jgi:mannose-1-phosphate guanylyltransferase
MTSLPSDSGSVYAVILAGGSGTRFWPASRRLMPKQLLAIGPSQEESLIRGTVRRLSPLAPAVRTLLLTGEHLVRATAAELPELPPSSFLAEPIAKNTAPCIVWAAAHVAATDPEAVLVVVPSDQHTADEKGFLRAIELAVASAREGHITTIGIEPTRPETGYGYIELGEGGVASDTRAQAVKRFVEKPSLKVAEEYVASGRFVWNAGMFVFRAKDMMAAFDRHLPQMAAAARKLVSLEVNGVAPGAAIREYFESAASVSIDYGIMEKEQGLRVVPASFGWSDLGSWESAWELGASDEQGNSAVAQAVYVDASRNLVHLSGPDAQKKVVALVGVEDLCVVDTGDALLVLPRSRSQDVRLVVEALKARGRGDLL